MDTDPNLSQAIDRLSGNIQNLSDIIRRQRTLAAPPCQLCLVCQSYHDGRFEPTCRTCIQCGWADFRHIDGKRNIFGRGRN